MILWHWPWPFKYFCKNLQLPITYEQLKVQLSYLANVIFSINYLLTKITEANICSPVILTLTFDHFTKKLKKNCILIITFALFDLELSNLACVFLVARPFQPYQHIWPCDPDLDLVLYKIIKLPLTKEQLKVPLSYLAQMIL